MLSCKVLRYANRPDRNPTRKREVRQRANPQDYRDKQWLLGGCGKVSLYGVSCRLSEARARKNRVYEGSENITQKVNHERECRRTKLWGRSREQRPIRPDPNVRWWHGNIRLLLTSSIIRNTNIDTPCAAALVFYLQRCQCWNRHRNGTASSGATTWSKVFLKVANKTGVD